jgi:hypothetical protein
MKRDFPAAASSATDRPVILGQNFMSCSLYLRSSQGTERNDVIRRKTKPFASGSLPMVTLRATALAPMVNLERSDAKCSVAILGAALDVFGQQK